MDEIVFANRNHKKNYNGLSKRVPDEKFCPANDAVIYLVSFVETITPDTADQILDFQNLEINHFVYLEDWQTVMTQNAIFLAFNLKHIFDKPDCYKTVIDILDASDWNEYFVEAIRICCDGVSEK